MQAAGDNVLFGAPSQLGGRVQQHLGIDRRRNETTILIARTAFDDFAIARLNHHHVYAEQTQGRIRQVLLDKLTVTVKNKIVPNQLITLYQQTPLLQNYSCCED